MLRRHGLDPRKVRFSFDGDPANLSVSYGGHDVGGLALTLEEIGGRTQVIPAIVELEPAFRGKGLGALTYLVAAKLTYDRDRMVLHKSFDTTRAADRLWAGFLAGGLAEPHLDADSGEQLVRLKKSVLRGGLSEVRSFYRTHRMEPR